MSHAPDDYALTSLSVPVHPELARLLGYGGERRFASFRWEPTGDELIYDDGVTSGDGNWQAWLLWTGHEAVWEELRGWDFGSSDHRARDALVIDRMAEAAYAGSKEDVRFFLLDAPDLTAEREAFAHLSDEEQNEQEREALESARRELDRLERFEEDPEALQAYVRRQMKEQQERLGRLEAWLDEHAENT